MNSDLRRALHSSEKSADEPRVVRRRRGDPIPKHDAHTDLSKLRGNVHAHSQHCGHSHGGDQKAKTVQSKHPWLVRH
jgi:hypothetical protein